MGRLIDADKLIEELYLNAYACTNDEVNKILHKQLESNIEVINNQPTAYDIDKVVEQLEEKSSTFEAWFTVREHKWNLTKEAIEIVKAGGIDE